eukprot:5685893-Pyramimonas_sp.AAC.1
MPQTNRCASGRCPLDDDTAPKAGGDDTAPKAGGKTSLFTPGQVLPWNSGQVPVVPASALPFAPTPTYAPMRPVASTASAVGAGGPMMAIKTALIKDVTTSE